MQLLWVEISLWKNCPDAAEKYNNDLWLYEQLDIAFLEDSAASLISETF